MHNIVVPRNMQEGRSESPADDTDVLTLLPADRVSDSKSSDGMKLCTCVYVYIFMYICIYACVYVCVCARVYLRIYICIYIYIYIYI